MDKEVVISCVAVAIPVAMLVAILHVVSLTNDKIEEGNTKAQEYYQKRESLNAGVKSFGLSHGIDADEKANLWLLKHPELEMVSSSIDKYGDILIQWKRRKSK